MESENASRVIRNSVFFLCSKLVVSRDIFVGIR